MSQASTVLDQRTRIESRAAADGLTPPPTLREIFESDRGLRAAAVEQVRVRFSPRVARWIRERYPRCEVQEDGSVVVTFLATSVEWLVRRVLEYGPDAEVLGPGAYREAVRRAVA